MFPVVLLEVRLVQLLLFALFVGTALDARRGDVRGMLVASVCAVLLWWRPLLAFGRGVADFLGWVRDKLDR